MTKKHNFLTDKDLNQKTSGEKSVYISQGYRFKKKIVVVNLWYCRNLVQSCLFSRLLVIGHHPLLTNQKREQSIFFGGGVKFSAFHPHIFLHPIVQYTTSFGNRFQETLGSYFDTNTNTCICDISNAIVQCAIWKKGTKNYPCLNLRCKIPDV